jgi:hypothetical protein
MSVMGLPEEGKESRFAAVMHSQGQAGLVMCVKLGRLSPSGGLGFSSQPLHVRTNAI